ncbi:hypothetical protein GCM10020255_023030 [Rhodococcus baikonurensis]
MNNLNNSDEVAIDVGRVALEASEGVAHGSDPEDFFLAAGNAVLFWLPLNGYPILTAEQMVPTEERTKAGRNDFNHHAPFTAVPPKPDRRCYAQSQEQTATPVENTPT